MSKKTKKQIISAVITFTGAFLTFIVPALLDPSWVYTGQVALTALLISGVRAGVKVLWEKNSTALHS